jgi:ABC-type uncharacterized transport system substrate-binding protein
MSQAWHNRKGTPPDLLLSNSAWGGKWLGLLKEIAPRVTRVAVLRDPIITAGVGYLAAIHALAPSIGVQVIPIDVRDTGDLARAVVAFARTPNGGLIVTADPAAIAHREAIITLAHRHRLPAVYPYRHFVADGGLMSYGIESADQYRQAAGYVDRILKGEKPGDLPVQQPTKYDLVINLKTAKALGLEVPPQLLARADEVIEGGGARSYRCSAALRRHGRSRRARSSRPCRCSRLRRATAHRAWPGFGKA